MKWSLTEEKFLNTEIKRLLLIGAIKKCSVCADQFISNIFLTPKQNGSFRLILNLKQLNKFIQTEHFKMEDHKIVTKLLTKNMFLASIDLKDAYHLVSIHKKHHKYLRFVFAGQIYEYTCLPFGLNTAPYLFTKLLKPVLFYLRQRGFLSVLYIDDFLLLGRSYSECLSNIAVTKQVLSSLGFIINLEKSILIPNTNIKYLGFLYNTVDMSVSLPLDKQQSILKHVLKIMRSNRFTIQEFAKLIGKLIAACPAIKYGWLYTKNCERAKFLALRKSKGSYNYEMKISKEVLEDLTWWKTHLSSKNVFHSFIFKLEIFSDSSRSGWGVYCNGCKSRGFWSREDKKNHINYLELLAAFFGLKCFATNLINCEILLRIDNTTAISYVNRMGGIQFPHLNSLTKQIWQWCEQRNLFIFASYIKSKDNCIADHESRRLDTETEFTIANYAFKKICHDLRTPEVDLFASRINAKCKIFASWFRDPEAEILDAFTVSWANYNFYAFPPFSLVAKVLQKIIIDRAEGIVVVPYWPSQPWYPLFKELLIKESILFSPNTNLLLSIDRTPHALHQKLSLEAGLLSGRQ